ncbi:AAA family ATPase [filamentous cyanobacterium LEGE 11480]|uniref:AAA family ATPase n=1 Tax=Romeriopsis navalis LEGE 11480 TaxID=2777977 RepID=A0A928VPH5_9CYAN|nr:AAA family ATPase [Romeriopsis navalis]MBE9030157.1 AAA family ATPase [Romeriopsis navalis LEGE 11480]
MSASQPETPISGHTRQLSHNWLIATVEVFAWLLLRPTAWRQSLAQIPLRPNFCLAELQSSERRHPLVKRLCWLEFLVLPIGVSLCIALSLAILGQPISNILFGVFVGFTACLSTGMLGGLVISIAASWIAAMVGGLLGGVIFGILGPDSLMTFRTGFAFQRGDLRVMIATISLPIVMASVPNGLAASVAASVETNSPHNVVGQRIGGIGLGILGSGLTLSVAIGLGDLLSRLPLGQLPMGTAFSNRLITGVVLGLLLGVMLGKHSGQWWKNLFFSVAASIIISTVISFIANPANGEIRGLAVGSGNAMLLTMLFALAYNLTVSIAGVEAGAIAGTLGSSAIYTIVVSIVTNIPLWYSLPVTLGCLLFSLTLTQWLPMLIYPFEQVWNLLLYRLDGQQTRSQRFTRHYLLWHSTFWDEHQRLLLWGLDRHLVLMCEQVPEVGQWAIAHISSSNQRWAARDAQIELDARQLEQCQDMRAIRQLHQRLSLGELAGPATDILRSFNRISRDAAAIFNQSSLYNQRLLLSHLVENLEGMGRELTRSNQVYAPRFRPVWQSWLRVAEAEQRSLDQQAETSQEIESPYIVGIPLNQQQEIFVGRQEISAQIERLLRDRRHSSLLLYGQRRMGKTSLLNHLGRLLPSQIVPFFIDLQGPASTASDHVGLLYNLAKGIVQSAQQYRNIMLQPLSREQLAVDPFTIFDEWIDQVEAAIAPATALLMLDEFEALNHALDAGRFDADIVLGMLRNLIQHRDRFRVLLAGTHTLEEFQRWSGYLINLQVLHLSYLSEAEARQLIEHPVRDFALRYEDGAVDRIIQLTHGHPFLVQLLCTEIVALKNEQPAAGRQLATLADIEAAVPEALNSGSFFFADIERNQLMEKSIEALYSIANEQEVNAQQDVMDELIQKEILDFSNRKYRFQAEILKHWFIEYNPPQ